ncbi:MAG: hypothetical protein EZS28_014276 [Streblomastix strix]|uniref:Uncharacterized protein n=1 Tax=Streblomastix strix TaxID=222440 RepID=A0A5J4W5N3_9EUKA|nr:MAG: hypothetical protein EZS28_014276 [Streblomastix strix]
MSWGCFGGTSDIKGSSEETVDDIFHFSFVKKGDVQKQTDKEIIQIGEKFNLQPDEATPALISKKQNNEKLTNSLFGDYDASLLEAGIVKNISSEQTECFTCYLPLEPDNTIILPCGHKYWSECLYKIYKSNSFINRLILDVHNKTAKFRSSHLKFARFSLPMTQKSQEKEEDKFKDHKLLNSTTSVYVDVYHLIRKWITGGVLNVILRDI